MGQTIAVLSLKGGTGKTTAVRTLADVLSRVGLEVLAIDLDPQGNLSDYFDVPPDATPTVADVIKGDAKLKAAVKSANLSKSLKKKLRYATTKSSVTLIVKGVRTSDEHARKDWVSRVRDGLERRKVKVISALV